MHPSRIITLTVASGLLCIPALAAPGNGNGNGNSGNNGNSGGNATHTPVFPAGELVATPQVVQAGTFPTLNWQITYPSNVGEVAVIDGSGTITLTDQVYVDVRTVGVGVTQSGPGVDIDDIPAEIRLSINSGSYGQVFYGTNTDVDPTHSLYTKKHNSGTTIDFGGRYVVDGGWSPFTTTNSGMQFTVVTDGQPLPANLANSGNIADYLNPYVDGNGNVNVGPMSVLVLAEYAETNLGSSSYDNQDLVLLVSFSTKNNNGHGNNIDGVDVSNPGKGKGGPNGEVDPSGEVDDER